MIRLLRPNWLRRRGTLLNTRDPVDADVVLIGTVILDTSAIDPRGHGPVCLGEGSDRLEVSWDRGGQGIAYVRDLSVIR